jgi:DNA mismatch repair ATPase MutS
MSISNIEKINDHFKLPIFFNENKIEVKEEIINDLELVSAIDPSGSPIYHYAFEPKTILSEIVIDQMKLYYTTDIEFLNDSQKLLSNYKSNKENENTYTNILALWKEIKEDNGFKQKYYYVDWEIFEFLNTSDQFLQLMSLYSLASPVLSFLVPVFILIIPFFIVKMKGLNVTLNEYLEVLKVLASNHAIGRIFTHFNNVPMDQKIYIAISAIFYSISIYQNFVTCYKFNENMKNIHKYLAHCKEYLEKTIDLMDNYLEYTSNLKTYEKFNESVKENREILVKYLEKISSVSDYGFSIKKINQIGYILKCFYELYQDETYNNAFLFSFGFNGYIDNLETLIGKIDSKKINFCTFTTFDKDCHKSDSAFETGRRKKEKNKKNQKTIFKKSYYAALINNDPVKNDIKLDKNIVITGPNASGKTTILKSTLINVIFSQQFGCGFYENAKLTPYKYIHSYLNIPDTSGRDSLFQAEARRCKEIIDIIRENPNENHLCSFDELYSGTNPDEAVISSLAFMEYLVKFKKVNCILTTHFIEVCKKLKKNKRIVNYSMKTIKTETDFTYTYSMKPGISEVRGGIKVLTDMNYPKEIIENSQKMNTSEK